VPGALPPENSSYGGSLSHNPQNCTVLKACDATEVVV